MPLQSSYFRNMVLQSLLFEICTVECKIFEICHHEQFKTIIPLLSSSSFFLVASFLIHGYRLIIEPPPRQIDGRPCEERRQVPCRGDEDCGSHDDNYKRWWHLWKDKGDKVSGCCCWGGPDLTRTTRSVRWARPAVRLMMVRPM